MATPQTRVPLHTPRSAVEFLPSVYGGRLPRPVLLFSLSSTRWNGPVGSRKGARAIPCNIERGGGQTPCLVISQRQEGREGGATPLSARLTAAGGRVVPRRHARVCTVKTSVNWHCQTHGICIFQPGFGSRNLTLVPAVTLDPKNSLDRLSERGLRLLLRLPLYAVCDAVTMGGAPLWGTHGRSPVP